MTYHLQRLGPKAKAKRRAPRQRGPFGVRRRLHPRAAFRYTATTNGWLSRDKERARATSAGYRAFAVAPGVLCLWPRNPGRRNTYPKNEPPCIVNPARRDGFSYCGCRFQEWRTKVVTPRHPRRCCPDCVALWREATKEGK